MPLDSTGFAPSPRILTSDEERDLAVLRAARHRIRHRWMWWDGSTPSSQTISGSLCVLQTVAAASMFGYDHVSACERLKARLPDGFQNIRQYNDARTTKHADVLKLFDRAIAELEPRE